MAKIFSTAAIEKVFKSQNAGRVSKDAKILLAKEIEEYAGEIADRSIRNASHFGRKTIMKEDIKEAKKEIRQTI